MLTPVCTKASRNKLTQPALLAVEQLGDIMHPGATRSPGRRRTHTQAAFFHPLLCGPVPMMLTSTVSERSAVGRGQHGHTDWLCRQICNKLWCSVYFDTFLSDPALTSSASWATEARRMDRITRTSLRSPRPSVNISGHQWPCTSNTKPHTWYEIHRNNKQFELIKNGTKNPSVCKSLGKVGDSFFLPF